MSILYGKPIRAFPEQDHESHIAVHIQFLSDPSLAGNPGANALQPILVAHIAEHVALLIVQGWKPALECRYQTFLTFETKTLPLKTSIRKWICLLANVRHKLVQQAPQMQEIKALTSMGQQGGQQNPLQYAQQLAQLEAESLKLRTQAEIQVDQAKAQSDMQMIRPRPSKICRLQP